LHVSIPINSENDSRSVSRSGQLLLWCSEAHWEILPFPCQQVIVLFVIFWVSTIILAWYYYLLEFQVFILSSVCINLLYCLQIPTLLWSRRYSLSRCTLFCSQKWDDRRSDSDPLLFGCEVTSGRSFAIFWSSPCGNDLY